jgi:hypothetical protein
MPLGRTLPIKLNQRRLGEEPGPKRTTHSLHMKKHTKRFQLALSTGRAYRPTPFMLRDSRGRRLGTLHSKAPHGSGIKFRVHHLGMGPHVILVLDAVT